MEMYKYVGIADNKPVEVGIMHRNKKRIHVIRLDRFCDKNEKNNV
jgi:hypothetical protein